MAVFEDCQATALTTWPPEPGIFSAYLSSIDLSDSSLQLLILGFLYAVFVQWRMALWSTYKKVTPTIDIYDLKVEILQNEYLAMSSFLIIWDN